MANMYFKDWTSFTAMTCSLKNTVANMKKNRTVKLLQRKYILYLFVFPLTIFQAIDLNVMDFPSDNTQIIHDLMEKLFLRALSDDKGMQ